MELKHGILKKCWSTNLETNLLFLARVRWARRVRRSVVDCGDSREHDLKIPSSHKESFISRYILENIRRKCKNQNYFLGYVRPSC